MNNPSLYVDGFALYALIIYIIGSAIGAIVALVGWVDAEKENKRLENDNKQIQAAFNDFEFEVYKERFMREQAALTSDLEPHREGKHERM